MPPLFGLVVALLLLTPPCYGIAVILADRRTRPYRRSVRALGGVALLRVFSIGLLVTIGVVIEGQTAALLSLPIFALPALAVARTLQLTL